MTERKGQQERLLDLLERNVNQWVPLPAILDLRPRIASHTRIVSYLRQAGHCIVNEKAWCPWLNEFHSSYKLVR